MNVYILTDMEGISLVSEWEQVDEAHPFYSAYQPILTAEVNAAVEGAIAAGAQSIVVNDGHGSRNYNLLWDGLNAAVRLERPDSGTNVFPSLDASYDAFLLVGYHAMAGTPNAVLPHTQSRDVEAYCINGTAYGEIGQMSLLAGYHGVPVAYISGDRAAVEEARALLGDDLPATVVKQGHAYGKTTSLHPKEAVKRIRTDVEHALRQSRRQPFRLEGPYDVTMRFKSEGIADHVAGKGNDVQRIDPFTVGKRVYSANHILDF